MRPLPRVPLVALCAFVPLSLACGKRGDPLPPLRRAPQPVSGLRVAQRGDRLEIALAAPRAMSDGERLTLLDVEFLRADGPGEFRQAARRETRRAAAGELLVLDEALPPQGTTVRVAARAIAKGRPSALTTIASLIVLEAPGAPADLVARPGVEGLVLAWTPPARMPTPRPPASPVPSPAPEPSPTARVIPGGDEPPAEASAPVPPVPEAEEAAPAPSPTPPPVTTGFWVYRRAPEGAYARPLGREPLQVPGFEDATAARGERWCYVVRTVASTDPVVESEASGEACATMEDVTAPAPPTGVTALARAGVPEVSWSRSPEPDLAHYRIYRASRRGVPKLLAELPPSETLFRDTTAAPGETHVYTITAVDGAGNESAPSASVRAGFEP
ncbi:MAG: hypothetical protein HY317_04240 [Acidobacteria bacterium]|nr:hypothetical protein [Acidobacteriota bacterium]